MLLTSPVLRLSPTERPVCFLLSHLPAHFWCQLYSLPYRNYRTCTDYHPARKAYTYLGILYSISVVPRTFLFWSEIAGVVPGICWGHSSSLGITVSSAPRTTVPNEFVTLFPLLALSISCVHSSWIYSCLELLHPSPVPFFF